MLLTGSWRDVSPLRVFCREIVKSDVCQYQSYSVREMPSFFYKAFLKPSLLIFAMIAQSMKGRLMVLRASQYSCFESGRFLRENICWSLIEEIYCTVCRLQKIFIIQREYFVFSHIMAVMQTSSYVCISYFTV